MKRFLQFLRRFTKYLFLAGLLFALLLSIFFWYITTDSFQETVRGRLISAIERATGGRAELGSFHVVPLRFQLEVRDLTIHGREAAGEVPLIHVGSMSAVVNLSSVLGAKIAFHSLTLRHPVVHIIFYPDGTTNQPRPRQEAANFERLFAIAIDRLDVQQGEVLWQDQPIPLQFVTNDISATLDYSFLRFRYAGTVSVGQAETSFNGFRPVPWSGQANFSISRNAIEVTSLWMKTQNSHLQFKGAATDLRNPVVRGNYDLVLDLAQAGTVARYARLTSGTLEVKGDGFWSHQKFSSTGNFDLGGSSFRDNSFSFKNVSAAGKFTVDPQKLSLSQVQGKGFGGEFAGDGEISNWQQSPKLASTAKERQRGSIKFKAKAISLAEILANLGPEFRPVNQLKLAGNASGTADIQWRDSIRSADTVAAVEISRPSRAQPGQVPVSGNVQVAYNGRSRTLQIQELSATTPATQLRGSGALSSAAPLRFSFTTTDLREWQPVIATLFPSGAPFTVRGRVSFNGSAVGDLSNPQISGNLQAQDFNVRVPTKTSSTEPIHWDSLATDLQVASRSLSVRNAVVRNGNTTVKLDGSVGLSGWNLAPDSSLRLHVNAQNADAAQLARLATLPLPVRGQLSGDGDFSGTVSMPEADASVNLTNGAIEGHTFDSASAFIQLRGSHTAFKNLKITRRETQLSGSGAYDLWAHTIQLNVTGANFDLAEFSPLEKSRIRVGGKLDFSAEARGSTNEPDVTAHLHFRNVTLNDETAGNYLIDAVTHGPDLRVTGRSDFPNAELFIDGSVRLRELWPAHINFHFTRLDVDSFLESYLHGHITGHSAVAGDLVLQGPLLNAQELFLSGNLTDFYADVEKIKLRNDSAIIFSLSQQALNIQTLHVVGESTDFSASGSMQLAGERRLNFHVNGTLGLQLLHTYDPDISASGTLSGDARLTGTTEMPLVRGRLGLKDGAVSDVNLPSALTEMNGSFLFSQNQISIQTLAAHVGGGTISFNGHAELVANQINFDLTAIANAVRLRYPPGVSSTADANLRWAGSSAGSLLSGDITVNKVGVTPGFDFGAYLERAVQSASFPQTDPVLNRIRLDLHVVTAPELQMQTSVLRLRGEADLRVRGNAAKPVLLGRADVFEGEAYFGGTKYRLERGGVTFANPAVTTPFLDLEATTRVRDYDITLSMTGPADKPKLNYRSEPPLPTADIITLLAFGQTSETSAQLQQTNQSVFSQQASSAMLTAALNATLNNRTQRLFGASSIKIDPQGLETETSPTQTGPAVTIEQQVKNDLTISYTTDVAQTSQQIIRAEYNLSRNVSVVAIRDQYGVVSFDVKIRRRKR
jgi:translocation and assembly module TamB